MAVFKQINFFSIGDSNDISTFSGIPFFFSKELERQGIIVNKVNLYTYKCLAKWYNRIFRRLALLINKDSKYDFSRSALFDFLVRCRVRQTNKLFPESEASIFITYCAHNYKENHLNILFGDWTFEYLLKDRANKDFLERKYIKRENQYISDADMVISLFHKSAQYIKECVPFANVLHLGQNVINDNNKTHLSKSELISRKMKRKEILFIGRGYYIEGLKLLINAFYELKRIDNGIILNVIGLEKEEVKLNSNPYNEDIHFYGFLRKDKATDCSIYYNLLNNASIFINPTPRWAGYTSMIEAMFYYTPIITSPYNEFVEEFGELILFGEYYDGTSSLFNIIRNILTESDQKYCSRCYEAHRVVSSYTWEKYVDALSLRLKDL